MTPQGMDPSFLNNPMVVNALTNGSMQYMPNAQFMTPQAYGNFRTLPDMMYQQPLNQQAGFLKSSMLASGWGAAYGLGYNPAVNPALQRVEASRLSSDTMTSTLSAIGGTVADFALPGLAFKLGGALKGVGANAGFIGRMAGLPLRFAGGMLGPAALIAQMALSNLVEGPQEKIANIRALQRISRGKIVTGGDIDSGMLTGFSTRAAKSLDDHLYRRSLYDGIYDADDYRRMMSEGVQAGLFDYTSSVDGYKKVLHNIRDNMATVMEVTGSDDFKDVMEQLKRLQDLGASQAQYKSILRSENMFARITGMSHGDLVSTYGAMGALEFNQRGLSQIQGSQVAMHNAALVTIGQRNGTLSNAYLAAHGGVSGMAQQMTGEDAQARAGYENVLLAALYDPYTGELRTDAQEYLNTMLKDKRNGFVNLAREAGKNMSILAQQGPEAVINFKSKLPDLNQKLAEQTGLDINEQNLRVAIAKGRNILGSDIDDRTAAIRGLVSMGFSEKDAQLKVDSYSEIQRHRNEEQQLSTLKKIAEYNKENNALSVWWRSVISPIKDWFVKQRDETGGLNARLDDADRDSVTASGRRQVQEVDSFAAGLAASYEASKNQEGKAVPLNFAKNNLGTVGFSGDEIQKELDKYKYARYEMGGNSTKAIDCSGLVLNVWQQLMESVNKAMGEEYYSKEFRKLYADDTTASGLLTRLVKAHGKVTQWGRNSNLDNITTGSTIFIRNKNDTSRPNGVIHVAMLMQDKNGDRYVVDATSRDGKEHAVKYMKPEDFSKHYLDKGYEIYSVNNAELNEALGGGQTLKQVQASLKSSGPVLVQDLKLARNAEGQVRNHNDPFSAASIYGGSDEYGSTIATLGKLFTKEDNSTSRIAVASNKTFDENYVSLYGQFGKNFGKVDKAKSLRALFTGLNFDTDPGVLLKEIKARSIAYLKNNGATDAEVEAFSTNFDNSQEFQDALYGTALSTASHDSKAWGDANKKQTKMSMSVNEAANLVGEEITGRIFGLSDVAFKGNTTAASKMRTKLRELQKKHPDVFNTKTLVPIAMLLTARKAKMTAVSDADREKVDAYINKLLTLFPGFKKEDVVAFTSGDNDVLLQNQAGIQTAAELLGISVESTGVDFSRLLESVAKIEKTTTDKKTGETSFNLGTLFDQLNTISGLKYSFDQGLQINEAGKGDKKFYTVTATKDWLQKQKFDEGSEAEIGRQKALADIEKNKTNFVYLSGIDMKMFADAAKTSKNAVDANGNTVLNLENSNNIQANPGKSLGDVAENTKRTANYARDMFIAYTNHSLFSETQTMNEKARKEKELDEKKAAAERTQGNNRV